MPTAGGTGEAGGWEEIADALLEHIAVLDRSGCIVAVNAAWRRFARENGVEPESVGVGRNYLDACRDSQGVPLPKVEPLVEGLQEILDGRRENFSWEYPCHSTGVERWFLLKATARPQGKGAVVAHLDVTQRRQKEDALHESRSLFSSIVEGITDAIFLCNPAGWLLLANSALADWLGKPASEIVGRHIAEFAPHEVERLVLEHNAAIIAGEKTRTFEIRVPTARRGLRTFLVTKGLNRNVDGEVRIFGIARDISELKAMEREIIDTSEKEKQRLGQDLHENLCQYLVGISLLGNVLFEDLLRLGLKQAEDARQITTMVKDVVVEVRSLVKGLSPMPIEQDKGLIAALEELAEKARAGGAIQCTLRASPAVDLIERAIAIPLYRIAQEAVHNALRHSQARKLQIRLTDTRRAIVLTVQDDGIGFSEPYPDLSSGLGLHIMNYRSRNIGAELVIRKLPGKGTAVTCTIPKREITKTPRKAVSRSRKSKKQLAVVDAD